MGSAGHEVSRSECLVTDTLSFKSITPALKSQTPGPVTYIVGSGTCRRLKGLPEVARSQLYRPRLSDGVAEGLSSEEL